MLILLYLIRTQGRELYLHDFIKYAFDIGLCWDTCELIPFKLFMMLDMIKFYSMIPFGMALTF